MSRSRKTFAFLLIQIAVSSPETKAPTSQGIESSKFSVCPRPREKKKAKIVVTMTKKRMLATMRRARYLFL